MANYTLKYGFFMPKGFYQSKVVIIFKQGKKENYQLVWRQTHYDVTDNNTNSSFEYPLTE